MWGLFRSAISISSAKVYGWLGSIVATRSCGRARPAQSAAAVWGGGDSCALPRSAQRRQAPHEKEPRDEAETGHPANVHRVPRSRRPWEVEGRYGLRVQEVRRGCLSTILYRIGSCRVLHCSPNSKCCKTAFSADRVRAGSPKNHMAQVTPRPSDFHKGGGCQ